MKTGNIKFYDANRGFGFICPTQGGNDIFFHASGVVGADPSRLQSGQAVSYEVVQGKRGPQASNVRVLEPATP